MNKENPKKLKEEVKMLLVSHRDRAVVLGQLDAMFDSLSDEHKKNLDGMYQEYYNDLLVFRNMVGDAVKIFKDNKVTDLELRHIKLSINKLCIAVEKQKK